MTPGPTKGFCVVSARPLLTKKHIKDGGSFLSPALLLPSLLTPLSTARIEVNWINTSSPCGRRGTKGQSSESKARRWGRLWNPRGAEDPAAHIHNRKPTNCQSWKPAFSVSPSFFSFSVSCSRRPTRKTQKHFITGIISNSPVRTCVFLL